MPLFDYDSDDEELAVETSDSEAVALPREFGVNFDTGAMTGEIVEGSEAVKVWAWFALQSARYRYQVYSWDYGSELESLIGTGYSEQYTKSRVQKMLEDCLLINENITGIKNLACTFDGESLSASFTLQTKFGEESLNV